LSSRTSCGLAELRVQAHNEAHALRCAFSIVPHTALSHSGYVHQLQILVLCPSPFRHAHTHTQTFLSRTQVVMNEQCQSCRGAVVIPHGNNNAHQTRRLWVRWRTKVQAQAWMHYTDYPPSIPSHHNALRKTSFCSFHVQNFNSLISQSEHRIFFARAGKGTSELRGIQYTGATYFAVARGSLSHHIFCEHRAGTAMKSY
jgi:hypothetical protein